MTRIIQKIIFSFSESAITHFGGMYLILRFCKKLRINALLYRYVKYYSRHSKYHPARLSFIVIYTIIAGILRLSGNRILTYNGTLQKFLGLSSFPSASRINSFLINFDSRALKNIVRFHDNLRLMLFHKPAKRSHITLDLDSTVLTVYGTHQGSAVGFNPHRKGSASYHPLLCFDAITKDFWHGQLRSGNTVSSSGALEFLKNCFAKIPSDVYRLRVRADSGFFAKNIIEYLDDINAGYAIAVRLYPTIRRAINGLNFKKFKVGYDVAEYHYKPDKWLRQHRFIVIRRPVPEQPSNQLTLFTFEGYSYQVIVTNINIKPEWVWKFYRGRWLIEQDIKELKENFTLTNIPTKQWQANETYFNFLLFAYNIANWFKRLCLPPKFARWNMQTLRTELLVIPARLVRTHNKNELKLPNKYVHKKLFQDVMNKIETLNF